MKTSMLGLRTTIYKVGNIDELYINGDHDTGDYYIGNTYTLKYELSQLILKDECYDCYQKTYMKETIGSN